MANRKTLHNWIRDVMVKLSPNEEACTALLLNHIVAGGRAVEVKSVRFGGNKTFDPKDLADLFQEAADTHAGGLPSGRQQYELLAFYNSNQPEDRYPLAVQGEDLMVQSGLGTEPATPAGLTSQLMRHNEALTRSSLIHSENMLSQMASIIDKLADQNAKMLAENAQVMEVAKQLVMEKAANEHEHRMLELKEERNSKMLATGMKLLPGAVNTLAGRQVFPDSTVAEGLVDSLAESLDEDQIVQLTSILRPEQSGPLMHYLEQRYKKLQAKKEE